MTYKPKKGLSKDLISTILGAITQFGGHAWLRIGSKSLSPPRKKKNKKKKNIYIYI